MSAAATACWGVVQTFERMNSTSRTEQNVPTVRVGIDHRAEDLRRPEETPHIAQAFGARQCGIRSKDERRRGHGE